MQINLNFSNYKLKNEIIKLIIIYFLLKLSHTKNRVYSSKCDLKKRYEPRNHPNLSV